MQAHHAHQDDETVLVARARTGDEDAFRELVEGHGRDLFRLAYRMTGNREAAEDVVQESFFKAYKAIHRFDLNSRFSTWLYRIAANCATDCPHRLTRRLRGARSATTSSSSTTTARRAVPP